MAAQRKEGSSISSTAESTFWPLYFSTYFFFCQGPVMSLLLSVYFILLLLLLVVVDVFRLLWVMISLLGMGHKRVNQYILA